MSNFWDTKWTKDYGAFHKKYYIASGLLNDNDIKKDLLDKILSGVYQQGSIIPNEYELAEIYNVSRPTIRKAVQILVDEGYLEKRKKRGTIVCDPTIRQEFAQVIQTFDKEVKEKGLTPSTKVLTFKQEKAEEEVRRCPRKKAMS